MKSGNTIKRVRNKRRTLVGGYSYFTTYHEICQYLF